jgi:glucose dehydrogenase
VAHKPGDAGEQARLRPGAEADVLRCRREYPVPAAGAPTGFDAHVFARSIDSGEARWICSPPAADDWLDAGSAELSLGEREGNGKKLKTLEYRDAAGNLLTLERETGKLVESIKTKAAAAPEAPMSPFGTDRTNIR